MLSNRFRAVLALWFAVLVITGGVGDAQAQRRTERQERQERQERRWETTVIPRRLIQERRIEPVVKPLVTITLQSAGRPQIPKPKGVVERLTLLPARRTPVADLTPAQRQEVGKSVRAVVARIEERQGLTDKLKTDIAEALAPLNFDNFHALPSDRRTEVLRELHLLAVYHRGRDTDFVTRGAGNAPVVVLRRRLGTFGDQVSWVSIQDVYANIQQDLNSYTKESIRPFVVWLGPPRDLEDKKSQVLVAAHVYHGGGVIKLTEADLVELRQAHPLPAEHPLSKLMDQAGVASERAAVLVPDPFTQRDDTPDAAAVDALIAKMQSAYPSNRLIREPRFPDTSTIKLIQERVAKLVAFDRASGRKAEAIFANVDDYNLMPNFKETFDEHGIQITDVRASNDSSGRPATGSTSAQTDARPPTSVLILTGHSNRQLAETVRSLGAAGHFRGKFVLFQTCETPLTRELKSEMIERHGAVAVLSFMGEIDPAHVSGFLEDVAPWLSGPAVINGNLFRFLRRNAAIHGMDMYESELERNTFDQRG